MGFADPASYFLDDLAQRRARAQALFNTSQQAVQSGVGALEQHTHDVAAQQQQQTQNALRLREVSNTETQNAALNQHNADMLRLETQRSSDEAADRLHLRAIQDAQEQARAKAENEATSEKQRTQQIAQAGAMASDYVKQKGPAAANIEEFSSQFLGQPGFEQLKPEDVQHSFEVMRDTEKNTRVKQALEALPGGLDADSMGKIAADTGARPEEIKAAAQEHALALQSAKDPEAERKSREKIAANNNWTQLQVEKMKATAEKDKAANKPPNANVVEGLVAKKTVADAADQLVGMVDNPNVDLDKIRLNLQAQNIVAHGGQLKGDLEAALTNLNPDEQKVASQMGVIMERSGLATTGGKRATPESGKSTLYQMTGMQNTDKGALKSGLTQYRDALRADLEESRTALPKEGAAVAPSTPTDVGANKAHADSYFGG